MIDGGGGLGRTAVGVTERRGSGVAGVGVEGRGGFGHVSVPDVSCFSDMSAVLVGQLFWHASVSDTPQPGGGWAWSCQHS